jgi:hypothetical protein
VLALRQGSKGRLSNSGHGGANKLPEAIPENVLCFAHSGRLASGETAEVLNAAPARLGMKRTGVAACYLFNLQKSS